VSASIVLPEIAGHPDLPGHHVHRHPGVLLDVELPLLVE